jgi:hypothetical protein
MRKDKAALPLFIDLEGFSIYIFLYLVSIRKLPIPLREKEGNGNGKPYYFQSLSPPP